MELLQNLFKHLESSKYRKAILIVPVNDENITHMLEVEVVEGGGEGVEFPSPSRLVVDEDGLFVVHPTYKTKTIFSETQYYVWTSHHIKMSVNI